MRIDLGSGQDALDEREQHKNPRREKDVGFEAKREGKGAQQFRKKKEMLKCAGVSPEKLGVR